MGENELPNESEDKNEEIRIESPEIPNPVSESSDLAAGLVDEMPQVSPQVVEQSQESGQERDRAGELHDPSKHWSDSKSGKGRFNREGYWAKIGGRKKKSSDDKKSFSRVGAPPEKQKEIEAAQLQAASAEKSRMAGIAAAHLLITLGRTIGGDEWIPIKNQEHGVDEKANLESAFGDYFVAKEIEDFPPGVALTIAVSGYVLPRFLMPKTKEKTKGFFGKVKRWFVKKKIEKEEKAEKEEKEKAA